MINIAKETLGLRRPGFSPGLRLLMPAFSLPCAPPNLAIRLQCPRNALLPLRVSLSPARHLMGLSNASETRSPRLRFYALAPINLRRKISGLVSYYALFKGWLLLSQPP